MDLSIIIVNWNSKDYLRKCIDSILATTHGIEFEIVVIDNASFDGCEEMLQQYYPQIRFIQGQQNHGFAKANNTAFQKSRGRNLLFLNPDTEVKNSSIETLYHQLIKLPNAGIVGATLLNSDGSVQTSCIQSFPTILNQLFDSNALRNQFPKAGLWGMRPLFTGDPRPTKVDAVSGACLMIKRSVFENVGMFNTEYFMYSEDIDLCFKVREASLNTYYVPTAVFIHHGGGSSSSCGLNVFSSVMMLESRWRFFRKTRGTWYGRGYRAGMFCISLIRIVLLILLMWPALRIFSSVSSLQSSIQKWKARLRWTLCLEKWVKNH
jgi:hypothetical protein